MSSTDPKLARVKCSVTLTVWNFAVVHAVSDEHIEQLPLLQIVSIAKANILPKLSIHVRIDLSHFGAMSPCEYQHSLVDFTIALECHHLFEVQQLLPHSVSHLVGNSFVDALVKLLACRFLIPILYHLDPLLLALDENFEFLFERLLVVLRRCWGFGVVHEAESGWWKCVYM